ncbi:uncharacterized protein LOC115066948, partial [Nannospalax galili]|uniref:uncharacterized protein LOC115066948 n=1 Tax=Nannospalax galili TaxID=1026970 RepID=UPI00111C4AFE
MAGMAASGLRLESPRDRVARSSGLSPAAFPAAPRGGPACALPGWGGSALRSRFASCQRQRQRCGARGGRGRAGSGAGPQPGPRPQALQLPARASWAPHFPPRPSLSALPRSPAGRSGTRDPAGPRLVTRGRPGPGPRPPR